MLDDTKNAKIDESVIAEEFYIILQSAHRALREKFLELRDTSGLRQQAIADRLGWDKALVSRRLHGRSNLTLKTMSALATAMECRLSISFIEHCEMASRNYHYSDHVEDQSEGGGTRLRFGTGDTDPIMPATSGSSRIIKGTSAKLAA